MQHALLPQKNVFYRMRGNKATPVPINFVN